MNNSKWNDLQAIQKRNNSIKEKILQWKRQRENILNVSSSSPVPSSSAIPAGFVDEKTNSTFKKIENKLIDILFDKSNNFPIDFATIQSLTSNFTDKKTTKELLIKFSLKKLIELNEYIGSDDGEKTIFILSVDYDALKLLKEDNEKTEEHKLKRPLRNDDNDNDNDQSESKSKDLHTAKKFHSNNDKEKSDNNNNKNDSVEGILSLQSTIEKENQKISEEIQRLLSKPTAKELLLNEQFRSLNPNVQEFCPRGTPEECIRSNNSNEPCERIHFLKIIQKHTDESLGDCSFLNTCFHMDTCKYVHYKVEKKNDPSIYNNNNNDNNTASTITNQNNNNNNNNIVITLATATEQPFKRNLFPAQWIRCDLRFFDMSILGKFSVVMADPPWDIHMELPYGTMSDDEMRNLNIPCLQDEGLIFLWVTGRAMELGRECLKLWGYERCDELIWVKTNQLQRIIRTGRTGHWINHGKEHCLVGLKGNPKNINRSLDCDVIVAEVRATSHKPDEIYGIIERLSPGTRKIELFGRQHNTQPNWVTLGNQLESICLMDPQLIDTYKKCYPNEIIDNLQ
uniref:mRNA m(6)A methyltransferase n=1 Tax=Dermatophagoides pteronyssinus TaxID=6956 RepID=A0A6P6XY15_DERPT|nr:N6-adenosine-methyltransferase catalytic subunit-like [Dermatophagoides pteronyssinus]